MKFYGAFPARVTAAQKRARAKSALQKLRADGGADPVVVEGRKIATSFWGKAWCDNLERYSDFASRLPRGRAYVRAGAVLDLRVTPGRVAAVVQGTDTYRIEVDVKPVSAAAWQALVARCAGEVASIVELLQGQLSTSVMQHVTKKEGGLFPRPSDVALRCSCPDGARLCKHVAAALYGVGARMDHAPELLFTLRSVDPADLVATAARGLPTAAPSSHKRVEGDLGALFGIDLDDDRAVTASAAPTAVPVATKRASARAAEAFAAKVVTRKELTALGVPGPVISNWLETGVLVATKERGVYKHTPASRAKVARYAGG